MYECPSCGGHSITFVRKWLASSAAPARCTHCGVGSAIAIVDASGALVAATLIITASGLTAAAASAFYPLLVGTALAIAYYFWRQHRMHLRVVPQQEAATAKRSGWIAMLALFFQGLLP